MFPYPRMTNFSSRLLTAFFLVIFLFFCLTQLNSFYLSFVVALFLWASLWEWRSFFHFSKKQKNAYDLFLIVLFSCYGFLAFSCPLKIARALCFFLSSFWLLVPFFLFTYDTGRWVLSPVFSLVGIFFIFLSWLSVFWVQRFFSPSVLLFGIAHVAAMDSFAYFMGRKWGVTKLFPAISPHKSVEGLGGAILGGFLVNTCAPYFFSGPFFEHLKHMTTAQTVFLSVLLVLYAVSGDLLESACKRMAGKKDSGFLLPGHGGVLDRFDSYFSVMPFLFCLVSLFLQ